jgi:hypothetical protein
MEMSNCYKGVEHVTTIHVIEHDVVLTQDITSDYIKTGKISPVLNLNGSLKRLHWITEGELGAICTTCSP